MNTFNTDLATMTENIKRLVIFNNILGLIPDLLVSCIISVIGGWGWKGFSLAFVGLQVLYLAIWLKDTIWTWITFALFNRKECTRGIITILRAGQFPEPAEYNNPENYLKGIIADETITPDIRMVAIAEYRTFIDHTVRGRIQECLRYGLAYVDALKMYREDFVNRL